MIERYITGLAFVLGGFGALAVLSAILAVDDEGNRNRDVFIYLGLAS